MAGLKADNIHIALQTCGLFDRDKFKEKLLPYTDLIFYDFKLFDPDLHQKYTGRSNALILKNFAELFHCPSVCIIPRVPLIPHFTATVKNLKQIARLLKGAGCTTYSLLPYNPAGIHKNSAIGKLPAFDLDSRMIGADEEKELRAIFERELS